jgi:hypothetical protein
MTHPRHPESESSDSTPPIKISRSTWVSAPAYAIVAFSTLLIASALAVSNLQNTDALHGAEIKSLDSRATQIEHSLAQIEVMRNDILWIRRSIEVRSIPVVKTDSNPNGH